MSERRDAAVRMAVAAEASMSARNSPVTPSMSTTAPWCPSSPRWGFSGMMQSIFIPKTACSPERCAGIQAMYWYCGG